MDLNSVRRRCLEQRIEEQSEKLQKTDTQRTGQTQREAKIQNHTGRNVKSVRHSPVGMANELLRSLGRAGCMAGCSPKGTEKRKVWERLSPCRRVQIVIGMEDRKANRRLVRKSPQSLIGQRLHQRLS